MGNNSSDSGNKVMLLGLEGSGKSTFLRRLIETQNAQKAEPHLEATVGFDYVNLKIQGQYLDIWDVGGDPISRQFWSSFYRTIKINYILYFIDLNKKESHIQALKELIKLVNEEDLKKCQITIIFNYFLNKNVFLDGEKRAEGERNAEKLIEKLREFPIYKYDTRFHSKVEDILKMNISDNFLNECFGIKED